LRVKGNLCSRFSPNKGFTGESVLEKLV